MDEEMLNVVNSERDFLKSAITNLKNIDSIEKILSNDKIIIDRTTEQIDIFDSISSLKASINFLLEENKKLDSAKDEWSRYNNQYRNYIINRLKNVCDLCNYFNRNFEICNSSSKFIELINKTMKKFTDSTDLQINLALEQFKFGDSNYVLFGKNGSGKTTLLKRISAAYFYSNSVVIPATRNIQYANNYGYSDAIIDFKNIIDHSFEETTMFKLSKLILKEQTKDFINHLADDKIISNKLIRIFDSLDLNRKLLFDTVGSLELINDNFEKYSLTTGSDGEKTIIYFIMVILLAPQNSFIFIDEPENHLNGALMKKLFDILESERPDLKFIYATNFIRFVESRRNCKLIYLEKGNKHNEWQFKDVDNYKNIPLDLILNIEGTNDDVIFCEGESDEALDNKLYRLLFPNHQIISSQGCEKVTIQTKIFNDNKRVLRRNAFGIIDNDFRTEEEAKNLSNDNIKVLKVNEIENAYMIKPCIEAMKDFMLENTSIDNIIKQIIDEIKSRSDSIKQDFATKTFRTIHMKNKFNNVANLKEELENINKENNRKFLEVFNSFSKELDFSIQNNDYDNLMRLVPGKKIIKKVSSIIGFSNQQLFAEKLLRKIDSDSKLRKEILNTIFFE